MIFTQENEYSAVLDACVLVPTALCDLLLRLAEEPAMYRPLWSEQILAEVTATLKTKMQRTARDVAYRKEKMIAAFPEPIITFPPELLRAAECIPHEKDRHVLAAAIMARANTIVTQNTRHFPRECLERYGVLCQTPDDFLIHQYHLCSQLVLDKVDDQAAGISQSRAYVIGSLKHSVNGFCELLEAHSI